MTQIMWSQVLHLFICYLGLWIKLLCMIFTFESQMNLKDIVQSPSTTNQPTTFRWSCRSWKTRNPCQCADSATVVMVADIHKMYNSIHIDSVEQHCHKFLWRNLNSTREPEVYAITGVNMGDKPTWAISTGAIYKTADMFREAYPEVATLLKSSTYVLTLLLQLVLMFRLSYKLMIQCGFGFGRVQSEVMASRGEGLKVWLHMPTICP